MPSASLVPSVLTGQMCLTLDSSEARKVEEVKYYLTYHLFLKTFKSPQIYYHVQKS